MASNEEINQIYLDLMDGPYLEHLCTEFTEDVMLSYMTKYKSFLEETFPDDMANNDGTFSFMDKVIKYLINKYTGDFKPWFLKTLQTLIDGSRYGHHEPIDCVSIFYSSDTEKEENGEQDAYGAFMALREMYPKIDSLDLDEVVKTIVNLDEYKDLKINEIEDVAREFSLRALLLVFFQFIDETFNPDEAIQKLIPDWESIEPVFWEDIDFDSDEETDETEEKMFYSCFKYEFEDAKETFQKSKTGHFNSGVRIGGR
jgi:hypothetical protein